MGSYRGKWRKRCPGCGKKYKFQDRRTGAALFPGSRDSCGNPDCVIIVRVQQKLGE